MSVLINVKKKRNTIRYNITRVILLLLPVLLNGMKINAQINVYPGQTALALAQKLAGQGVTITGATLTCPSVANGIFKVVSSNIGLDSGIVLTTGRAATQGTNYGVNGYTAYLASNNNGAPGDASLTTLAGQQTLDACGLEFDVVPNGDTIRFSYIFSSEEYINAVCGPYNDAFAFFISGPGIAGSDNMALIPGTNIPVTINSINNGVPGSQGTISNCTSMGPGAPFTTYYINNNPGATLTHQGFTKVLQAIHAVTPCGKYHLKMVIADAGNALYDSGVFLKAGSLQAGDYSVSALSALTMAPVTNDTSAFCIKSCLPGTFVVKRSQITSQPQTIRFSTSGDAVSGIDYTPLTDSVTIPAGDSTARISVYGLATAPLGPKIIKLIIYSPFSCSGISGIADSALMTIYDTISIAMITPDTMACRNTGVALQVQGYDFLNYQWSPASGLNNPNIKDPVASPSDNTSYQVTAIMPGSACPPKKAQVAIAIKPTPSIEMIADTTVCYNQQVNIPAIVTPANPFFSYQWNGPKGFTSTLQDPVIDSVDKLNEGNYNLLATNDTNGCKANASIHILVNVPAIPQAISPQVFCLHSQVQTLTATGDSLLWFSTLNDSGSSYAPIARTDRTGTYSYYVAQKTNECESPKVRIDVEVKKCCDGRIFIPNAFTPDGDGHNDIFEPVIDYGYYITNMHVFNRWGQAVYTGLKGQWDGTFGGIPAETGTYFYKMTLGCIQGGTVEKTGDVILIR